MTWQNFLDDYHISYKDGQSNIYCHCPFCPAHKVPKLGLKKSSTAYGCFRDSSHVGRNPIKLIIALLGVNLDEAKILSKKYFPKNFSAYQNYKEPEPVTTLTIPDSFYAFTGNKLEEKQFSRYLAQRGFDPNYTCSRFDLRWSLQIPCQYRLIIPIKEKSQWLCWTARAINPNEELRYLTASIADGANDPKNLLFDSDNLNGGDLLVITEGPFDAMAITQAMIPGVSATCTFGKLVSDKQFNSILNLKSRYESIAIGFDEDAWSDVQVLGDRLGFYLPTVHYVCPEGKDWAEMTQESISTVMRNNVKEF
jgi:hypothetical protein